jgi:hypothetical protein
LKTGRFGGAGQENGTGKKTTGGRYKSVSFGFENGRLGGGPLPGGLDLTGGLPFGRIIDSLICLVLCHSLKVGTFDNWKRAEGFIVFERPRRLKPAARKIQSKKFRRDNALFPLSNLNALHGDGVRHLRGGGATVLQVGDAPS